MLSDQPLRHARQAKRKRNKKDGSGALALCFYAVVFWRLSCVGMPQYLCDAILNCNRSFFRSGLFKTIFLPGL